MLNDILWPDHIQWQPPTDQTLYWTRPFTEFWVVSIEHVRRVWHADRGRLLLRTPGPVLYGICKCSFVETTDTQSYITPVNDCFPWLDCLPTLTLLLNTGFHWASATGVACRNGMLTPPDTWSRLFGTCIYFTCWDQSFPELVVILPDYALRISLGTFSILLLNISRIQIFRSETTKQICHPKLSLWPPCTRISWNDPNLKASKYL